MRTTFLSAALTATLGLFVVGCASDGSMKDDTMKDDKAMSMTNDRAADKVVVTTGRGQITYGWDKEKMKPMALTGEATACPMCNKAVASYYTEGKMPPETCPDCGAKIKLIKGTHGGT